MKKKILMSLVLTFSMGLSVFGCRVVDDKVETKISDDVTQNVTTKQLEEDSIEDSGDGLEDDLEDSFEGVEEITSETEPVDKQSVEGQLALISENFSDCFVDDSWYGMTTHFTVADLNRNGRLELIISDCQGTGLNSYTCIYEVSEDFDSLELMPLGENSAEYTQKWMPFVPDGVEVIGDILLHESLDCYEKDGVYYYIVKDSTSGGYDYKVTSFYFYRFDGEFECEAYIGGFFYRIIPNKDDPSASYVKLFDSNHELLSSDAEYEKNIEDVLSEYNYVSSCVLKWDFIPEENEIEEKVKAAYEGYNPDANMDATDFSSRVWLEEGWEYTIVLDDFDQYE